MDKAITAAYGQLDKTNQGSNRGDAKLVIVISDLQAGRITYNDFEEFVNQSDLEEALALITGQTGPRDVAATVDASKMVCFSFVTGSPNRCRLILTKLRSTIPRKLSQDTLSIETTSKALTVDHRIVVVY